MSPLNPLASTNFFMGIRYFKFLSPRNAAAFPGHALLRQHSSLPPYGPVGVQRAVATSDSPGRAQTSTLFTHEFALTDRVALVTGANSGIGLETAMAFVEAGARVVYCLDIPKNPGNEWTKVQDCLGRMGCKGRLEYVTGDVRNQDRMWGFAEKIGDKEGRLDVCVASAGVSPGCTPSFDYTEESFQRVMDVNLKGVLFTAQAAGRQMSRFGNGGSIILVASVSGHVALEPVIPMVSYHASKAAVLQLARSIACEHALSGIRVNTISPSAISTPLASSIPPDIMKSIVRSIPLGRIGQPHELRGAMTWLASDASLSFCTGSDILVSGGHTASGV